MALRTEELAKTIDQTLLDAEAAPGDVEAVCRRARDLHLASVCVLPAHVSVAAEQLRGSDVKACAVIGYPLGPDRARRKIAEAERALADGAVELEFVMNVQALRAGDVRLVRDELVSFVRSIRMRSANGGRGGVALKAVVGTAHLDDKLKQLACRVIERAEVDFAQTSHGAAGSAATVHDVELLREWLSESVAVKACGGIDSLDDLHAMANAGAARIGSARAIQLLDDSRPLVRAS
jgi:deoxyribose-phosphate aldolase